MTRHTKLIDHDIQEVVRLLQPDSDEQRALLENTLQGRRNEEEVRWKGLVPGTLGRILHAGVEWDHTSAASGNAPATDGGKPTEDIVEAELVTSKLGADIHAPVLDIDFPATLVPSSTPGHYHLYLDKPMTWEAYQKMLLALQAAGVLQEGYVRNAIRRGFSGARLPWIKKKKNKSGPTAPTPSVPAF